MVAGKKIVTVLGATGNQGGSVVDALLKDGTFAVRGVTRNADSDKAKALAAKGVEVVTADAFKKDQLVAAFNGSYAVYAVTNFWDSSIAHTDNHDLERVQGVTIADAAAETHVKHLIWSSLPFVEKISNGKYKNVVHFDGKAKVQDYIISKNLPATFLHQGFYFSNFIHYMPPRLNEKGELVFATPMTPNAKVGMVDPQVDTGIAVLNILKAGPEATKNLDVNLGQEVTPLQFVDTFAKVTGRKSVYVQLDSDTYLKAVTPFMGPVLSNEFLEMMLYFNDYGYFAGADLEKTKKWVPKPTNTEQWLKESKWTGPQ